MSVLRSEIPDSSVSTSRLSTTEELISSISCRPEFDKETFDVMWELSKPGSETEGLFLRAEQKDYFEVQPDQDIPVEWMPNVRSPLLRPDSPLTALSMNWFGLTSSKELFWQPSSQPSASTPRRICRTFWHVSWPKEEVLLGAHSSIYLKSSKELTPPSSPTRSWCALGSGLVSWEG
jgi:hypothetical protein